ncbi:hypothetical protein SASPL_135640 [Salvia splendens]|uniref:Uncharacterized protein n=1 Tax=Salvia splendens TaxID=180675 RepID=A0A8X8WZZ4_SALSN|nr:hypothetical protein SASPL_135640 [Salvia splendens]
MTDHVDPTGEDELFDDDGTVLPDVRKHLKRDPDTGLVIGYYLSILKRRDFELICYLVELFEKHRRTDPWSCISWSFGQDSICIVYDRIIKLIKIETFGRNSIFLWFVEMPRGGFTGRRASAPISPSSGREHGSASLFDVELQDAGPQIPLDLFDVEEENDVDEENNVEGEERERNDTVRDCPSPTHDQDGCVYIHLWNVLLYPPKDVANVLHDCFQNIVLPDAFLQSKLTEKGVESYWLEFKFESLSLETYGDACLIKLIDDTSVNPDYDAVWEAKQGKQIFEAGQATSIYSPNASSLSAGGSFGVSTEEVQRQVQAMREQVTIEVREELEKQNEASRAELVKQSGASLAELERQNAASLAELVRQNAELRMDFEKKDVRDC